jgi:transposase
MRYELNDHEWSAIKPMLPNKPHGARRAVLSSLLSGRRFCVMIKNSSDNVEGAGELVWHNQRDVQ